MKKCMSHINDNTEEVTGDCRVVHSFPSMAKNYLKVAWNLVKPDLKEFPHFVHGAIKGRRRETAIASQIVINHRLSMCKISFS